MLFRRLPTQLAAAIPGARKIVLPNTAHVPNMEQPEVFNQLVLDFLDTLESIDP